MDEISKHNQSCFVCGMENPQGLSLSFKFINQKAIGVFHPNSNYQGYSNVLHGGIISSLLDGAMNRILIFHDKPARTGKLSVRFKKETGTNDPLYVIGKIVKMRKNFALTRGEIRNQNKELIAFAEATFILKNHNNKKN
jgi:acyl-coenzyme A thioesterase PaaI-like protein